MAEFRRVQRIVVSLWGKHVGVIVPASPNGYYAFKYDRQFLKSGIEIAPLMMPLRAEPYVFSDLPLSAYSGLPPVFADSLPDSFGNALIDRWLIQHGFSKSEISPLDRLAYIGGRGMGALTYEPEHRPNSRPTALDMRQLVEEARLALNGELAGMDEPDAMREIIRVGSSAGGAQAKAIVGWNRTTGEFMLGDVNLPADFEPWIIKFTPPEYPWRGEREFHHYEMARAAGLRMRESAVYEIDQRKHFMTRRFDREGAVRHHVLTLSALAHYPMTVPTKHRTYEQLLVATDELGLGYEAMEEQFRRIAFNVLSEECDDHTKNFSFLMKKDSGWELAPAYDLTGSNFPAEDPWSAHGKVHQLSVNGKFIDITDADLLTVADRFGIGTAPRILEQVKSAVLKNK